MLVLTEEHFCAERNRFLRRIPWAKARAILANFFPGLPFLRQGEKAQASTLKPESGADTKLSSHESVPR
jgi:hypothetical protein